MYSIRRLLILFIALSIYVGCSSVKFGTAPSDVCLSYNAQYGEGTCEVTPEGLRFRHSHHAGQVDVLFVDDNSGSMSQEQKQMGEKFPHFLGSVAGLDYNIGIITTDISVTDVDESSTRYNGPREANGNGAFQDGNLLTFSNGEVILRPNTPFADDLFKETIQREETVNCENSGFERESCPSPDERGIYAINMALDRADSRFFRKDSHLAVVILSDEDERSDGGRQTGYPMEDYDLADTLVTKLSQQFGFAKTMSVHAVIVEPDDHKCLDEQTKQHRVGAFFGEQYYFLAYPDEALMSMGNIIEGEVGSICSNDYGRELGDIGSKIQQNVNLIQLACQPEPGSLAVAFEPNRGSLSTYQVDDYNRIELDPPVPSGTTVFVDYLCPRNL